MAACEKCGAQLAPYTPRCNYCNTVTAFGAAQQAEQARYQAAAGLQAAQYEQVRAQQAQFAARAEVERSAEQAFNWSLAGLFLCCIPVLPIVATVMAFRTRALAISKGIVVPSKVWMAVALSVTSVCAFGGSIIMGQRLEAEKASHKQALEKAIGKHAADEKPSVDVVCKLTELYLLDAEFKGAKITDGNVNCDGSKWSVSEDRGELTGVQVKVYESSAPQEGNVCLRRGQKWVVEAVVTTSCAEYLRAKAAGSASASSTAAAESAPSTTAPSAPASSPAAPPKPPPPKRGR